MRSIGVLGRTIALVLAVLAPAASVRAADTVTIGTVGSASANLWPVFIGIDKGFFAAENIKPDLVYVPASAAVIQQARGRRARRDNVHRTGGSDPRRRSGRGARARTL